MKIGDKFTITGTDADGSEVTQEIVIDEAAMKFSRVLRLWLKDRGYPSDHWIFGKSTTQEVR